MAGHPEGLEGQSPQTGGAWSPTWSLGEWEPQIQGANPQTRGAWGVGAAKTGELKRWEPPNREA